MFLRKEEDHNMIHDVRITNLENNVVQINQTLFSIGNTLERMNNKIDKIDSRLEVVEEKVETLDRDMKEGFREMHNRIWSNYKYISSMVIGGTVGSAWLIAHVAHWL